MMGEADGASGGAGRVERLPAWLTVRAPNLDSLARMKPYVAQMGLHTVCQSAMCPNQGECYSRGTATFMILGDICSRACRFCAVGKGTPGPLDPQEPRRVAEAVRGLGLRHAVITSVTRDDLPDGGAAVFSETIALLRELAPGTTVEVLVPDFGGSEAALRAVLDATPDVINHNVETAPRLYPTVRPQAEYQRSLELLRRAKALVPEGVTKSGLMVGLGESAEEVTAVMEDLRAVGCDMLTIGQYLRPSRRHLEVVEYITPAQFGEYQTLGEAMGFAAVASAPLVRSSWHAAEAFAAAGGHARG